MKVRFRHILIFFLISLSASVALAQEGLNGGSTDPGTDSDRELFEREKIISSPGEGDTRTYTRPSSTPAKESNVSSNQSAATQSSASTAQPAAQQKVKTEKPATPANPKPSLEKGSGKSQDDSILSFNFLYYIIEKYKLQDIVD